MHYDYRDYTFQAVTATFYPLKSLEHSFYSLVFYSMVAHCTHALMAECCHKDLNICDFNITIVIANFKLIIAVIDHFSWIIFAVSSRVSALVGSIFIFYFYACHHYIIR